MKKNKQKKETKRNYYVSLTEFIKKYYPHLRVKA